MTASDLKPHIISALEAPLDIHQERIDDDSLNISNIEMLTDQKIRCQISYKLIHMRCCAGPFLETPTERELTLVKQHDTWVDWLHSED